MRFHAQHTWTLDMEVLIDTLGIMGDLAHTIVSQTNLVRRIVIL